MNSFLAVLGLGFFLGMRHATDADHVVAVSTIVARQRRAGSAAFIGALWGVGHTMTILLVGGAIILFRLVIPPRLGLAMELTVGVMLIVLGIMNLAKTPGASGAHSHPHPHPASPSMRPLVVGIVHGLAGSAAVALLVLATIGDPLWSVFYLLIFGLGTIVGMILITMVIALPYTYGASRFARWTRGLQVASGALSVGLGVLIAYQVVVDHGLFSALPSWTPR